MEKTSGKSRKVDPRGKVTQVNLQRYADSFSSSGAKGCSPIPKVIGGFQTFRCYGGVKPPTDKTAKFTGQVNLFARQ